MKWADFETIELEMIQKAMDKLNKTYAGEAKGLKKYVGELTKAQLENGEAVKIVNEVYKKFIDWAKSGGTEYADWYNVENGKENYFDKNLMY
jgi:hypothetical protein